MDEQSQMLQAGDQSAPKTSATASKSWDQPMSPPTLHAIGLPYKNESATYAGKTRDICSLAKS